MPFHPATAGPSWFAPLVIAFLSAAAATLVLAVASGGGLRFLGNGSDKPGPRIPALMGGLAIIFAFAVGTTAVGLLGDARYLLAIMALMFVLGLWTTLGDMRQPVEIAAQVVIAALLAKLAGVELHDAGDIIGVGPIRLGIAALPLTVIAMVALARALVMMDDLEGFRAAFAFTALAWLSAAGAASGLDHPSRLALLLEAALSGYLMTTVLLRRWSRPRVFLGNAGGLMIGFALGWLTIDLTQGPGRSVPPIAAIFFVLPPLFDAGSIALRRFERRESPLERTENGLHHYLFARGFTPAQTLVLLVAASALLGAVGFFGWLLGVPEPALFWIAFFGFLLYHAWIKEAWRKLRGVHFAL
ncbi:MAG TPA: MraY family glycosyltransferase [Usitatibacter sp.]|nr:MraY family glycosyltransferase [Usitatibacter sp.]